MDENTVCFATQKAERKSKGSTQAKDTDRKEYLTSFPLITSRSSLTPPSSHAHINDNMNEDKSEIDRTHANRNARGEPRDIRDEVDAEQPPAQSALSHTAFIFRPATAAPNKQTSLYSTL